MDRHGRVADGERGEHLGNDSGLGFNESSRRLDERSCDRSTASDAFLRRIACGAGASPQSLIFDRLDPCDRRSSGRPEGGSGGLAEPARATLPTPPQRHPARLRARRPTPGAARCSPLSWRRESRDSDPRPRLPRLCTIRGSRPRHHRNSAVRVAVTVEVVAEPDAEAR